MKTGQTNKKYYNSDIPSQGRHALIIFEGAQVGGWVDGEMGVDTAVGLCFTSFFIF